METFAGEIRLEDNHLLALEKPAGMATAPPVEPGEVTLADRAKDYLKEKYQKSGNVYLGVVHRLDRPTSGLVLFARTSKAAARLSAQFQERETGKTYLAWVEERQRPLPDQGEMLDWMRAEGAAEGQGVRMAHRANQGAPGAKEAVLHFQVVARGPGYALVQVNPKTGRTHQIRAQFAWRGYPLVGDERYGAQDQLGSKPGRLIGLHAWGLSFNHPTRNEPVAIESRLPQHWTRFSQAGTWLGAAMQQLKDPWLLP